MHNLSSLPHYSLALVARCFPPSETRVSKNFIKDPRKLILYTTCCSIFFHYHFSPLIIVIINNSLLLIVNIFSQFLHYFWSINVFATLKIKFNPKIVKVGSEGFTEVNGKNCIRRFYWTKCKCYYFFSSFNYIFINSKIYISTEVILNMHVM